MDMRRAAVGLRKAAAEKGVDVKVSTGAHGQFQIFRDGAKLFDYKETGNLPATGELLKLFAV
jgi:predicted Rdx family selenoprotein